MGGKPGEPDKIILPTGTEGKEYTISIKMRYVLGTPQIAFGSNITSMFEIIGVLEAVKSQIINPGQVVQQNAKKD